METTTTSNIDKSTHGIFTIAKDFNKHTVLITKPSPRSRLGIKIMHHYSFRSTEISQSIMRMNLFVEKFIKEQEGIEAAKLNKKSLLTEARDNFKNPFSIGDILYESGGYEQTNVYFFQVIKNQGKSIIVRELHQERTTTEHMSGSTIALKDQFCSDKEITKRIQIRVWNNETHMYVNGLSKWDGQPKYWSSYH